MEDVVQHIQSYEAALYDQSRLSENPEINCFKSDSKRNKTNKNEKMISLTRIKPIRKILVTGVEEILMALRCAPHLAQLGVRHAIFVEHQTITQVYVGKNPMTAMIAMIE